MSSWLAARSGRGVGACGGLAGPARGGVGAGATRERGGRAADDRLRAAGRTPLLHPARPLGDRYGPHYFIADDHALTLFSGLGRHYDAMGAVLSFGQDPRWRRELVAHTRAGRTTLHRSDLTTGDLADLPTAPGPVGGADVRPGGAVWPQMNATTGFFTLALMKAAASSSAVPPISPIIMMARVAASSLKSRSTSTKLVPLTGSAPLPTPDARPIHHLVRSHTIP